MRVNTNPLPQRKKQTKLVTIHQISNNKYKKSEGLNSGFTIHVFFSKYVIICFSQDGSLKSQRKVADCQKCLLLDSKRQINKVWKLNTEKGGNLGGQFPPLFGQNSEEEKIKTNIPGNLVTWGKITFFPTKWILSK